MIENHEIFCNKNKKVVGKGNIEFPEAAWIHEFIALRSKTYSFKCNDKNTKNLHGISKSESKYLKFEEYEKCLNSGEYKQACDNFLIRSLIHEMFLQRFDDKRYFEKYHENKPWKCKYI